MARILLCAKDPGGANVALATARVLAALGHEVLPVVEGMAIKPFAASEFTPFHVRLENPFKAMFKLSVEALNERARSDIVVSATCYSPCSDVRLLKAAQARGADRATPLPLWWEVAAQ